MESIKYIEQLQVIPCNNKSYDLKTLIKQIESQKKESMAIEIGIATEIALLYAFDEFNVNDEIMTGFANQYPDLAEKQSLYQSLLEKGGADINGDSLTGFISGIKGKVYEMELVNRLNEQYDGFEFGIAESATQPIWDIKGINADGAEILIQAKMGGESYASEVQNRMLENPDVLFATSTEIQEKILENHPELASQFIDIDISNAEFTTEITENVQQLIANHGADFFDGAGEFIPVIGEVVVGVKLLKEISSVKNEYRNINKSHQDKIKMIKAIMYLSRYGVTTALITASVKAGLAAGATVDVATGGGTLGLGTAAGAAGGLIGGMKLSSEVNNYIKPHLYDMALGIMDYTRDDLFYFKNKSLIDNIGKQLANAHYTLAQRA